LRRIERLGSRSAAPSPPNARRRKTCQCAFPNQVALKLGERAEDVEDQLAGTRRIDVLGQTPDADTTLLQGSNRLDQMLERSPQPIQAPYDVGVTLAQLELREVQTSRASAARTAVKTAVTGRKFNRLSPHEMRLFEGQVGQESHLHPAVVEVASFRPPLSLCVH
jgi:hypothetical protein